MKDAGEGIEKEGSEEIGKKRGGCGKEEEKRKMRKEG